MNNRFWRNTKTEKHRPDSDPLDTNPIALPPPSDRKCICEYCGSQLTPRGEVLRMGEKAKELRKLEETLEKRNSEISKLQTEVNELKAKISEMEGRARGSSSRSIGSRVS